MEVGIVAEVVMQKMSDNKKALELDDVKLFGIFQILIKGLEEVIKYDNCIQMEGTQIHLYGLLERVKERFMKSIKEKNNFNLAKSLSKIANIIFALSTLH